MTRRSGNGSKIDGADLTLGILALVAAAGYLYETAQIPESLLEDSVGARGVPLAIGWVMAALGALLCVRGLIASRNGEPSKPSSDGQPVSATERLSAALRPHLQAIGLLAILAAYVALLPHAGYVASTALLIGGVAWFSGGARSWRLAAIAIAGSVFLWAMFDPMLSIPLPAGTWWESR
jgi:hypothetical protein